MDDNVVSRIGELSSVDGRRSLAQASGAFRAAHWNIMDHRIVIDADTSASDLETRLAAMWHLKPRIKKLLVNVACADVSDELVAALVGASRGIEEYELAVVGAIVASRVVAYGPHMASKTASMYVVLTMGLGGGQLLADAWLVSDRRWLLNAQCPSGLVHAAGTGVFPLLPLLRKIIVCQTFGSFDPLLGLEDLAPDATVRYIVSGPMDVYTPPAFSSRIDELDMRCALSSGCADFLAHARLKAAVLRNGVTGGIAELKAALYPSGAVVLEGAAMLEDPCTVFTARQLLTGPKAVSKLIIRAGPGDSERTQLCANVCAIHADSVSVGLEMAGRIVRPKDLSTVAAELAACDPEMAILWAPLLRI